MANKTISDLIVEAHNLGKDNLVIAAGVDAAAARAAIGVSSASTSVQKTTIAPLTGTVGTANNAMTALTAVAASTLATDFATQKTSLDATITAYNTKLTEINNNLADLQAKVNAIITALG